MLPGLRRHQDEQRGGGEAEPRRISAARGEEDLPVLRLEQGEPAAPRRAPPPERHAAGRGVLDAVVGRLWEELPRRQGRNTGPAHRHRRIQPLGCYSVLS